MNTREIAEEYRLSHWAGVMNERRESGLSVKQFCENAGYHENRYYYWQKKLRETACGELTLIHDQPKKMMQAGFTEVKLTGQTTAPPITSALKNQISIEMSGIRITADSEYPIEKLAEVLKDVKGTGHAEIRR